MKKTARQGLAMVLTAVLATGVCSAPASVAAAPAANQMGLSAASAANQAELSAAPIADSAIPAAQAASGLPAPNDPELWQQWSLKFSQFYSPHYTHIDEAWSLMPASSPKVRVAVLDNGFDLDHPDLAANINRSLAWNTREENNDVSVVPNYANGYHGTHVTGVFGAVTNNGVGVAGVAYNHAEIVPIKTTYIKDFTDGQGNVTESRPVVTPSETAKGIRKAVELGCKVINISSGTYMDADHPQAIALEDAVNEAVSKGVVVIAGAGNGTSSNTSYPSDYDEVISVTATNITYDRAYYSDANEHKNIAAPGGGPSAGSSVYAQIYNTVPGGYAEKNGTSMAAPYVTGVVALMLSANPNLTVDEVKSILYGTATDLGAPGRDDIFGHGLVNARAAVQQAIDLKSQSGSGGTGGNNSGGTGGEQGGAGENGGSGGNGSDQGSGGSNTGGGNPANPINPGKPGDGGCEPGVVVIPDSPKPGECIPGTGGGPGVGGETIPPQNPAAKYIIKFRTNGGKKLKPALAKKTVTYGKRYGKLPRPKRAGYKFKGWYTKKKGGKKITAKSIARITKHTTLYARWKRRTRA